MTATNQNNKAGEGPIQNGPVKWFDEGKGFGFVLVGNPPGDAFLHISVLRRDGIDRVVQGDRISCFTGQTERGLTVISVTGIDRAGIGLSEGQGPVHLIGRVKFYDQEKGYGFITVESASGPENPGSAETEVFVGSKLLKRLGLAPLRIDQAVKLTAVPGERGLVAETLTFLP